MESAPQLVFQLYVLIEVRITIITTYKSIKICLNHLYLLQM